MKWVKPFLIINLFLITIINGQEDTTQTNYWINIGARSQNKDLSIHYSFNIANKNLSFNAILLGTGRFFGTNSDGYSTTSIIATAGYSIIREYSLVAFFAGPGFIWGKNQGTSNWYTFNTLCFGTNIQAYFFPVKHIGLGLEVISNLNKEHSFNQFHFSLNYLFN